MRILTKGKSKCKIWLFRCWKKVYLSHSGINRTYTKKLSIPLKAFKPFIDPFSVLFLWLYHVQSNVISEKVQIKVLNGLKKMGYEGHFMIFKHLSIYNVTLSSVFNSIIMVTDICNTNNSYSNQIFRSVRVSTKRQLVSLNVG